MKIIFIVLLKEYMASDSIFYIIIYKFSYKEQFSLFMLFNINKSLKIGLNLIILIICFFVSLKLEYNRKLLFNTKKIAKKKT